MEVEVEVKPRGVTMRGGGERVRGRLLYDAESVWALTFIFFVPPFVCPNPRPVRRTRTFYFCLPTTPIWPSSVHSGRSPPDRRDLASDTWSHGPLIEKHFVLPPNSLCGLPHILLSIASYHCAQELTRPAKKWLAKSRSEDVIRML